MLDDPMFKHTALALLILFVSAVAGRLLRFMTDVTFRRFASRTPTPFDDRILLVIEEKIAPLCILGGASLGISEVRKGLTAENVTNHVLDYLSTALFVFLILMVAHLLSRLFKTGIEWYAQRVSAEKQSNIGPTIVPFASKIVNIVLVFIVGMIVLDHLGVNIGGLLVSLGVGSLAVALAAQETIANMIAWVVILIDQPARIGDRIRLPSGEEGDVHYIGLRSTRILNPDNNFVIIPNSEIVKNRIVNLSEPDPGSPVAVEAFLAHGADIDRVRIIALSLLREHPGVLKIPPPDFFVIRLGETSVQVRLAARIPEVRKRFQVETELRARFYSELRKAGVEFPPFDRILVNSREAEAAQKK